MNYCSRLQPGFVNQKDLASLSGAPAHKHVIVGAVEDESIQSITSVFMCEWCPVVVQRFVVQIYSLSYSKKSLACDSIYESRSSGLISP